MDCVVLLFFGMIELLAVAENAQFDGE